MSASIQAGVAYLADSQKSLKIIIDEKEYFIHIKDVYHVLNDPEFKAHILKLMAPFPEQLVLKVAIQNQTEGATY